MINQTRLDQQLILHEGVRAFPYRDTVGKLTIGVGRNLDDRGLSADEISYLLSNDKTKVAGVYDRIIPWWNTLGDVRMRVLMDMGFNMGPNFILKWPIFKGQVQRGEFEAASKNMLSTLWARQVGKRPPDGDLPPQRAWRLSEMMRTGVDYTR